MFRSVSDFVEEVEEALDYPPEYVVESPFLVLC